MTPKRKMKRQDNLWPRRRRMSDVMQELDGGGGPSSPCPDRGSKRPVSRGKYIPLPFSHFTFPFLSLVCLFATNSSLTILMFRLLLAFSSFFVGFETAPRSWACKIGKRHRRLEMEAQQLEMDRGVGKLRETITGSEVEGLYGLLRGVTSCAPTCSLSQPPPSWSHLSPGSPISQQPPQESTGPEVSGPAGQATVSAPSAATPAPESNIPADMQLLRIQLGGAKRVYQCWVEGCKEGPSTSWAAVHALISGRCIWEWGWCAHSAAKPFSIQTSSGITKKLISKTSLWLEGGGRGKSSKIVLSTHI